MALLAGSTKQLNLIHTSPVENNMLNAHISILKTTINLWGRVSGLYLYFLDEAGDDHAKGGPPPAHLARKDALGRCWLIL